MTAPALAVTSAEQEERQKYRSFQKIPSCANVTLYFTRCVSQARAPHLLHGRPRAARKTRQLMFESSGDSVKRKRRL